MHEGYGQELGKEITGFFRLTRYGIGGIVVGNHHDIDAHI